MTGASDGYVEVWDVMQNKLRDLDYQNAGKFINHDKGVLCLNFSKEGDFLVTGSANGQIRVWQLATGKCIKKLDAAHTAGVTSVSFSKDNATILSSSFDNTVKVHGLKSGNALLTLEGHKSYVTGASYSNEQIVTWGADGYIRFFKSKTGELVSEFQPGGLTTELLIYSVTQISAKRDHFLVCNRSPNLYIVDSKGVTTRVIENPQKVDFMQAIVSPKGSWIHAMAENRSIYCFPISLVCFIHDTSLTTSKL